MSPSEAYKRFRIPAYVLLTLAYIAWTNLPHVFHYGMPWKLYFPGHTLIFLATVLIHFRLLIPKYFRREQYLTYGAGLAFLFLAGSGAIWGMISLLSSVEAQGYSPLMKMDRTHIILGSLFSFSVEFWMLSIAKVAREWYKKYDTIRRQQFEHMKEELRLLRAQLDPHFMFNTLNNIYLLVLNAAPGASESVLLLSELLSYILYESKEELVSLEKELEFIESYISLQQLRLDNTRQVIFDKKGAPQGSVPPLILFNFIENAFKHAYGCIEDSGRRAHIFITLQIEADSVSLEVKNGFRRAEAHRNGHGAQQGIGLSNTRKRLELIYPGQYNLTVGETATTYSVTINIPVYAPELSYR